MTLKEYKEKKMKDPEFKKAYIEMHPMITQLMSKLNDAKDSVHCEGTISVDELEKELGL